MLSIKKLLFVGLIALFCKPCFSQINGSAITFHYSFYNVKEDSLHEWGEWWKSDEDIPLEWNISEGTVNLTIFNSEIKFSELSSTPSFFIDDEGNEFQLYTAKDNLSRPCLLRYYPYPKSEYYIIYKNGSMLGLKN